MSYNFGENSTEKHENCEAWQKECVELRAENERLTEALRQIRDAIGVREGHKMRMAICVYDLKKFAADALEQREAE
jgi:hypothetical protein